MDLTDDELYGRYLSGDIPSYDQLMLRYADGLTWFLFGFLHNEQDADDLMIEAFARIMVKKPKIGEGCFKAYLYKTARNLAVRFRSRAANTGTVCLEDAEALLPSSPKTDERFEGEERRRILHKCLARMDKEEQRALWLIYFEDMSYNDAASVLGVSKKRVDRLLQNGKQHLKAELAKEGITNAYE